MAATNSRDTPGGEGGRSATVKRKRASFYCEAGNLRAYLQCPKQCKDCKKEEQRVPKCPQ